MIVGTIQMKGIARKSFVTSINLNAITENVLTTNKFVMGRTIAMIRRKRVDEALTNRTAVRYKIKTSNFLKLS